MAESNINNGAFEGDQTASSTWEAFNEAKQDFNYLESTKATVEQVQAAENGIVWKATLAEVNAIDPLVAGTAYGVYEDGDNNGYYYWDGVSTTVTFNRSLGEPVSILDPEGLDPVNGVAVSGFLNGVPTLTGDTTIENYGTSNLILGSAISATRAFFFQDTIPQDGTIKNVKINSPGDATLKIKRFKLVASTYEFQSEVSVVLTAGYNEVNTPDLVVEEGDYIAVYNASGYYIAVVSDFGGVFGKSGYSDNTTDTSASGMSTSDSSVLMQLGLEVPEVAILGGLLVSDFDPLAENEYPSSKAIADYYGEQESESTEVLPEIMHIPCYGQSLSINTNAGASTFDAPVDIAIDTNGNNNNIQDMNGGYIEMFKQLAVESTKPLPEDFKIMTSLGGSGGKALHELSQGTAYYNVVINNIGDGKTYADAQGKTYSVPAICYSQGEADYYAANNASAYGTGNFVPEEYADKLIAMVDAFNTDIKYITGQSEDVKLIIYQVGSHAAYARYPSIAHQQLKAALKDERIILAKTMYDIDYNVDDYAHAPAKTYRKIGNHYGIALYKSIVLKENVRPIFPIKNELIGNEMYIHFHVPVKPLTIDNVLVTALSDGNHGFNLLNVQNETSGTSGTAVLSNVSITDVTIVKDDVVKITFSGTPPSGHRLTYGVNGSQWDNINGGNAGAITGRVDGARGNLRDSQNYINSVDDYLWLHNFAPYFEIIIK